MASIGGVSSNNTTSSLFNSANMISGLASGLDTEGMIESLVQSYQTKIQNLSNKITKIEWKQDAYRSIISKMVAFSNKYTSYTSSTNLTSPSFFTNSVNVIPRGDFKDCVSASGKTGSDIQLNAVHQLARAAQYRTKSSMSTSAAGTIEGESTDLFTTDPDKKIELSNLSGGLTLTYGSKTVSISFSETGDVDAMNDIRAKLAKAKGVDESKVDSAEVLAGLINQKLADEKIVFNSGSSENADQRIEATVRGGNIVFREKGTAQNGVYISGASGNIASQLGLDEEELEDAAEKKPATLTMGGLKDGLTRKLNGIEYLAEKSKVSGGRVMSMSLDGSTKQITLPRVSVVEEGSSKTYYLNGEEIKADADNNKTAEQVFVDKYTEALQKSVKDAFGDKVDVANTATDGSLKLEFKVKNEGSDLVINSTMGKALGIGTTATSYLNTGKKLGELLDGNKLEGLTQAYERDNEGNYKLDAGGNRILAKDSRGDPMYDFKINNVVVGSFSKNSTLSEVLSAINSSDTAGVRASYSQTTQSFTFTAKETGADSKVEMGEGLAQLMFGKVDASAGAGGDSAYTAGQDAKFTVTVNGEQKNMVRSSNNVNIDGMTISMEETFNSKAEGSSDYGFAVEDANKSVTFQSKTDSDKIIDAVKAMVEDYNTMMSEIKSAYNTLPYQKSNGAFGDYEPLSDDDRAGMSESAIERYEEKAKQGILFGDRNLSALYTKMSQVFSFTSTKDVDALKEMGIELTYSVTDGTQALKVDESKLRAMLDSDPDRVADLFTKTDGIMDRMKTNLDNYARTTGEPKGILIQQAGSPLSSLSLMNNQWQKEIDNITNDIEKWQDKLESQVDRYTSMFSRLEVLMNQMNSQSSTLAGLMGG